jgi:hypothetical protein
MSIPRSTAILEFDLPGTLDEESRPLTCELEYSACLRIDGVDHPVGLFRSPINDAMWREFSRWLEQCNHERDQKNYGLAQSLREHGAQLYTALQTFSMDLAGFLADTSVPRRLVIRSRRPEIHQLPWGALYDRQSGLLAAADVSIVQCWDVFALDSPRTFGSKLNIFAQLGPDTGKSTRGCFNVLPDEVSRTYDGSGPRDILHLEEHGDPKVNTVGGVNALALADQYGDSGIALLWSCFSASPNSWGKSPALALHRQPAGPAIVLSFQAELHNMDASSISNDFYLQVFGPAATRDPETALVRIRADKYKREFAFGNWASMTVFQRQPLDLSALPLNGPRVPAALWSPQENAGDTPDPAWDAVATLVGELRPGFITEDRDVLAGCPSTETLPRSAFAAWRGNVIRLDGDDSPLSPDVLKELNLSTKDAGNTEGPDRLIWFFDRITHFGAPLIVWTNSRPRHAEFIRQSKPSSALTFLLLHGPEPAPTVTSLAEQNELAEAIKLYESLQTASSDALTDEGHVFAYFSYSRSERQADAQRCITRLPPGVERLLVSGNYVSRWRSDPDAPVAAPAASAIDLRHMEEDCYRKAIDAADGPTKLRDRGRARHQLAYFMQCQQRIGTAEIFYRRALQDLEQSASSEALWHSAFAGSLRDLADLLATQPGRLDEASRLLDRALAIHTYHGRALQIAYSLATRAKIALTSGNFSQAIDDALDAANRSQECNNWRSWTDPFYTLMAALSETRESHRMLALIHKAGEKVKLSDLKQSKKDDFDQMLKCYKAEAHWIAGELEEVQDIVDKLPKDGTAASSDPDLADRITRMQRFLQL